MKFQLSFSDSSFFSFVVALLESKGYEIATGVKGQFGYFGQEYASLYVDTAIKLVRGTHGSVGMHRRAIREKAWGVSFSDFKQVKSTYKSINIEDLGTSSFIPKGRSVIVYGFEGYDMQFFKYGSYYTIPHHAGNRYFHVNGTAKTMLEAVESIQALVKKENEAKAKKKSEEFRAKLKASKEVSLN